MAIAIQKNPWADVYTWFWYNDAEIFDFTQEDFDRKAADLHEKGVTIVMTFSVTHFRFTWYPYWTEITEALRKLVCACHKYGIRVVDHHSSHLTFNLRIEDGWKHYNEDISVYPNKDEVYGHWYKIYPFIVCDQEVAPGKRICDFSQIDGRTGTEARNGYGAYSLCFNNEDYRAVYFNYLKSVVATGIDGIMNDDVQYFGDGNACTCPTCRKLFKEQYGYDLPDPEHWAEFYENYDNPAYVAWKKFKFESTSRYYRDLTAFYESLGRKMERPNYASTVLWGNWTCYSFDRCTDLWTMIFQENCFSSVMKQGWMQYYAESVHRYAAGRRVNVPSASMFYPDRHDSAYFGWSLARSWGQMYNGSYEGKDVTDLEKPFRDFENAHIRFYTAPDKIADVSYWFSHKTRDFVYDSGRFLYKTNGGIQSAHVSGLGVDMVFETDTLEELCRHETIVVSAAAMISDDEITRLVEYARRGGRLIILHEFALRKDDGTLRTPAEVEAFFGKPFVMNQPMQLGDGEVWRMDYEPSESEYHGGIFAERRLEVRPRVDAPLSKWHIQKAGTGKLLKSIITNPKLSIDCANDRVLLTGYGVENGIALHLINLADTLAETPTKVQHDDIIPNFTSDGVKVPEAKLSVAIPAGYDVSRAVLYTPELSEGVTLSMTVSDGTAKITVPGGLFSGYALIEME